MALRSKLFHNRGQAGYFLKFEKEQKHMTIDAGKQAPQRSVFLTVMIGVLVFLLAFVAVTFYLITRDSRNQQQWIGHTTNIQVLSQQMAKSASEAAEGTLIAFFELSDARDDVAHDMGSLQSGDKVQSLPPLPESLEEPLSALNDIWQRIDSDAQIIVEREDLMLELAKTTAQFIDALPKMQALTDEAVRTLTQNDAPSQQIFVAGRQLVLSDRILRHLNEILRGGNGMVSAADNFSKEVAHFEQMLTALLRGSTSVGVAQVRNTEALNSLAQVQELFQASKPQIDFILKSSPDLLRVRGAADELFLD
ncbi:MAG: type IV pili methyl-accepting chemotaxis transducer N-terminal domain-containing protein, partial [Lysobacterales bacterium]